MCAEPSLSKTRSSFKGCVFAPIPCHKEQHHGSHGRQVLLCIQIRRKSLCTRDLDARLPPETTFCTGAPSPVESSHAHCPRYHSHHFSCSTTSHGQAAGHCVCPAHKQRGANPQGNSGSATAARHSLSSAAKIAHPAQPTAMDKTLPSRYYTSPAATDARTCVAVCLAAVGFLYTVATSPCNWLSSSVDCVFA